VVNTKRAQSRKTLQRKPVRQDLPVSQKISAEVVNQLKEELLRVWNLNMIPDYHRQIFFESIYNLPASSYTPVLGKEIEEVSREQAPVQNTFRAIVARESCLFQIQEMDKVIPESGEQGQVGREMLDEMVNILHSLRMLSLHVVKCVIDWRKQLVYNYLIGQQVSLSAQSDSQLQHNKFKTVPFVYEEQNYLLKMHSDAQFLIGSHFAQFFNFSPKSDPFLVFPS